MSIFLLLLGSIVLYAGMAVHLSGRKAEKLRRQRRHVRKQRRSEQRDAERAKKEEAKLRKKQAQQAAIGKFRSALLRFIEGAPDSLEQRVRLGGKYIDSELLIEVFGQARALDGLFGFKYKELPHRPGAELGRITDSCASNLVRLAEKLAAKFSEFRNFRETCRDEGLKIRFRAVKHMYGHDYYAHLRPKYRGVVARLSI